MPSSSQISLSMRSGIKRFVRFVLDRLGYALVTTPDYRRVVAELERCETMRIIRKHDAVELEQLYRHFVFPDLPLNEQRSGLLHELIGTTIGEAIYIINGLHATLAVPGDICEFGVAQGVTSRLLAAEILRTNRNLWLFDSFQGLPKPGLEDRLIDDIFGLGSIDRYEGTMASPEEEVRSKLDLVNFPRERTKVKKGWIKDSITTGDLPSHVAFAYVDFDFYEPIKDALEFLDGRMPAGGKIVVDDYGFFSEGAQLAVDRFMMKAGDRFKFELPLPFAGHFCVLSRLV